ncbi:hypothetical protein SETIT_1G120600v2 [Setaria italica]|uniref:Uncharacterized protein n=1 Tax=Setaria italica TaxID=4555 RepID=A0A368PJE3_SETIT|nr:hypothetical protein SETIT_1G120600v2 [Setaria italica]
MCGYVQVRYWISCLSVKAIRRKTIGTGRMRYLRHLPRRFKSNFGHGKYRFSLASPKNSAAAATDNLGS